MTMNLVLMVSVLVFVVLCVAKTGLARPLDLERSGLFLLLTSLFTAFFYAAFRLSDGALVLGALAKMLGEANYAFLILFLRAQRKVLSRRQEQNGSVAVLLVSLAHLTLNLTLTGHWQLGVMSLQVLVLIGWVGLEAWWLWRARAHKGSLILAVLVLVHWWCELIGRSALVWQVWHGVVLIDTPLWTDATQNWMWVSFFMGFMAQLAIAGVVAQQLRQDKDRLSQLLRQVELTLQEKESLLLALVASHEERDDEPHMASLAHELRQPLGAIQLNAEYLASSQRLSRDEESQVLQEILRENQRAVGIVQGLRGLFMNKGKQPRELLDLSTVLSLWCARQASLLQRRGVDLHWQVQPGAWVRGSATQLEMVFQNLVNNAVEAMSCQGGAVHLTLVVQDSLVVVDVADQGPGLSAHLHEKIFEMGYSTKTHGMGLGLWLSRRIAQLHRGQLGCVVQATGTRMRLTLPLELA